MSSALQTVDRYVDRGADAIKRLAGKLRAPIQKIRRSRRERDLEQYLKYGEGAELGEINPRDVAEALNTAAHWKQDPSAFFELVTRMGISSVYRGATRTRRNAITQLKPMVDPLSETGRDPQIAKAITDKVLPLAKAMAGTMLRAAGHGVSVLEIEWFTGSPQWYPVDFAWRSPERFRAIKDSNLLWFATPPDSVTRNDYDGIRAPLIVGDGRWIDHRSDEDGATPFVSGHSTPCMLWWLAKIRSRVRWSAFIDTYGMPMRIGRYTAETSDEDLQALKDAVRNLGRDIGALLPTGMPIEIINAAATIGGTSDYFGNLVEMADKQMEIEILGQTASTEGVPGQLGENKAQDRVRRDIALADAAALTASQTNQLARPFVDYNYGVDVPCPEIQWIVPEPPDDLEAWSRALYRMTGRGLLVVAEQVYERLHLRAPKKDEETIGGMIDDDSRDSGGGGGPGKNDNTGSGGGDTDAK